MKIVSEIMKENPCYKAGKKIKVKGLMLHSVGCPQPDAATFIKSWNRAEYKRACVHAFIDGNNGTVYQTLPWNHRGWHCGGAGNNEYIGVELCEPDCIVYTGGSTFSCSDLGKARKVVQRTYESAVELFAYLCAQYGMDPMKDGVILSHREGHARGIASDHGDPEHLWRGLQMGYTMTGFRKDVKKAMEQGNGKDDLKDSGRTETQPYLVRVSIPNLNIRKGPGTHYGKTGRYTGVGVFTIVEEAYGQGAARWGRLKSRSGWISLDYTRKISGENLQD